MLTATAAVAATPQTPVTNTQQPVKKAETNKEQHATKEHHATKGNMKAHSATHATKVREEKATAKPEATKEQPKEAPKAQKRAEYKK